METVMIRIQHPDDGYGLFHSQVCGNSKIRNVAKLQDMIHRHKTGFPVPWKDKGIGDDFQPGLHLSAFKSIKEISDWIKKDELKLILSMGFRILAIEAKSVLTGEHQYVFKLSNVMNTIDITDLFK